MTNSCIQGYNATLFAYGQTGAGKTYTVEGPSYTGNSIQEYKGLIPRVFEYLFATVAKNQQQQEPKLQYIIKCSYLEIYQENIIDLLDPVAENLRVREDLKRGVYVEGLLEETVQSSTDLLEVLNRGKVNRHVGATSMNKESSRSHSVFTLIIESKTETEGVINILSSRFNIIDLAGSERQKSTEAAGERLKEAGKINKSLSALGNVINSLVDLMQGKSRFVPYRDSKLTFLLKDSLGGNSKTVIIANVSPSISSAGETLSTLNFARRAKYIRNKAIINEDTIGTVLILQKEIKRLKAENLTLQNDQMTKESGTHSMKKSMSMKSLRDGNRDKKRLQTENLLQSTVDLRNSESKIYDNILREKDHTNMLLKNCLRRYQN